MGSPLSIDTRQRLITLLEKGMSASAVGSRLLIARSTATRLAKIWREEGRITPLSMGGDRRSFSLEEHATKIRALVTEKPDIFLSEIVEELALQGIAASETAVRDLLARHGLTVKKNTDRDRTRA